MRVITKKRIQEFSFRHPNGDIAAREWFSKSKRADWSNFNEMKQTFNSVDYVGNDRYVFNLAGNNYRLIAIVRFRQKLIFIRFIGSHSEYDKIKDIKTI